MSDPINGTEAPAPAPEITTEPTRSGIVVAAAPVTIETNDGFFELSLREPGIVRGCAFWMHEPKVVAAGYRGLRQIPMPLLLVECRTDGEMKRRKFFFIPSDRPLVMREGFQALWRATAIMPTGAGHLFEIVEASS